MEYVLTGFRQFDNIRRYYIDTVGEKLKQREQVTVSADHRIPLQELPLLCRRLLEGHAKTETITFTEPDMVRYASDRAAAQAASIEKRRKYFLKAKGSQE